MVEVLDVLGLERRDLRFDELVEFTQIGDQIGRQIKIHQKHSSGTAGAGRLSRSYSNSTTRRPPAASTIESLMPALNAAA